jgi:hypothetical protein
MLNEPSASIKPANQALLNMLEVSIGLQMIFNFLFILIQFTKLLKWDHFGPLKLPLSKLIILIKSEIEVKVKTYACSLTLCLITPPIKVFNFNTNG